MEGIKIYHSFFGPGPGTKKNMRYKMSWPYLVRIPVFCWQVSFKHRVSKPGSRQLNFRCPLARFKVLTSWDRVDQVP